MGEEAKDSMFFAVWFSELCSIEVVPVVSIKKISRGEAWMVGGFRMAMTR